MPMKMVRCLMLMCVFLVACTTHTPPKENGEKEEEQYSLF